MLSDYLLWSHLHLKLNFIYDNKKRKIVYNSTDKNDACKVNLNNNQIESKQNATDDVNTLVESIGTTFKSDETAINEVVIPNFQTQFWL